MLTLQELRPTYLTENKISHSAIWLKHLSFPVGKIIEIIAPSGSGKTSLIHFLYGLRHQYEGNIMLHNRSVTNADPDTLAVIRQQQLSVVLQDLRLFPSLTVRENLLLKAQLGTERTEQQIQEWLDALGVADKWNTLATHCSYGEQQRIAIVRALIQPFEYLLLDEPFSHLDENNAHKALELILAVVQQKNAGMILADLNKNPHLQPNELYHL